MVVSSWLGLSHGQLETEKRHIMIIADARQALTKHGEIALGMVDAAFRLFGLLAHDCRLSPRERDLLHATFGFDEVLVPAHGHVVRPVRVAWYSHDDSPALPQNANSLVVKRNGLWKNPIRNRRVARLARAVANGEAAWLDIHAPNVAQGLADVAGRRTVVLVENVDHAVAIAHRLPSWPIVTGPEVDCSGLTTRQRELLSARRTPRWQYPAAIVTAQGFKQLSLDEIDVVVRASAGCGAAPIPEDSLVVRPPRDRPLLVVDVRDRRHPVLARWARRRRDQYGMKGWLEPGREPIVARMIQFLKTRPRRQS